MLDVGIGFPLSRTKLSCRAGNLLFRDDFPSIPHCVTWLVTLRVVRTNSEMAEASPLQKLIYQARKESYVQPLNGRISAGPRPFWRNSARQAHWSSGPLVSLVMISQRLPNFILYTVLQNFPADLFTSFFMHDRCTAYLEPLHLKKH